MEYWELEARECIRDLAARYNANGDSGRFEAMLALFADDAVMEASGQTYSGSAAIRDFFESVARNTTTSGDALARFVRHFTSTHQIDIVDRSSAKGRAYFLVLTDQGLDHWGRYIDEYRRMNGTWVISRRQAVLEGARPGGWGDRTSTAQKKS